jgi:hypothetical protein
MQIDTKRHQDRKHDDLCYATYVGPGYAAAPVKILFIGLDTGADSQSYDLLQRRAGILDWYKTNNWNQHYSGCIKVAGYILDSECLQRCASRCTPQEAQECVLHLFGQGNAVKCVPVGAAGMDFNNRPRISGCLPLMFEEIQVLRPQVVVLQGRNDLHEPFFTGLSESGGKRERTKRDFISVVTWPNGVERSIVVSLNHPSHGHLQKDWEPDIIPALDEARRLLSAEATSALGVG